MPASQPEKSVSQGAREPSAEDSAKMKALTEKFSQFFAEERAKWEAWKASPEGKSAAAKAAAWNAKTPEEQEALLDAQFGPRVQGLEAIDEFTGMDDDEAGFLRDWLG